MRPSLASKYVVVVFSGCDRALCYRLSKYHCIRGVLLNGIACLSVRQDVSIFAKLLSVRVVVLNVLNVSPVWSNGHRCWTSYEP